MNQDQEIKGLIIRRLEYSLGEENRISKGDLLNHVNNFAYIAGDSLGQITSNLISDRQLRKLIQELREDGPPGCYICSSFKGHGGYFMATDAGELDKITESDYWRGITIINRVRKQRKAAGLSESPQIKMEFKDA